MQREVKAALKADKSWLTAEVRECIMSELQEGDVQEAFRHLKGRYRNASETQAKPCHQTMERQTDKKVELYAERAAYSEEFPENGTPFRFNNNPPLEGELQTAVSQLSHGQCGGALGICAEHIKAWLHGAKKAEDPENGINHVREGKTWDEFIELCLSVWATGTIPQQMCWVVTVLPKRRRGVLGHRAPRTDLEGSGAGHGYLAGEDHSPQQPPWLPCQVRHGDGDNRGKT
jgi:hypothetical protein